MDIDPQYLYRSDGREISIPSQFILTKTPYYLSTLFVHYMLCQGDADAFLDHLRIHFAEQHAQQLLQFVRCSHKMRGKLERCVRDIDPDVLTVYGMIMCYGRSGLIARVMQRFPPEEIPRLLPGDYDERYQQFLRRFVPRK